MSHLACLMFVHSELQESWSATETHFLWNWLCSKTGLSRVINVPSFSPPMRPSVAHLLVFIFLGLHPLFFPFFMFYSFFCICNFFFFPLLLFYWALAVSWLRKLLILSPKNPSGGWLLLCCYYFCVAAAILFYPFGCYYLYLCFEAYMSLLVIILQNALTHSHTHTHIYIILYLLPEYRLAVCQFKFWDLI